MQGELEHRRPKARFARTDKKHFIKQMARIERRETRIRRIRAKLKMPIRLGGKKPITTGKALKDRYYIGQSQNEYQHIGEFLRNNAGDPAVHVSMLILGWITLKNAEHAHTSTITTTFGNILPNKFW